METISLTMRKNLPLEVFKSIRIIGKFPDKFIGHLNYIRLLTPDYDYKNGDILDECILESIKHQYPDSYIEVNNLLLFDQQLDNCMLITRGGLSKNINTFFYPTFNPEHTPTNIKGYRLNLNLRLWMNSGDPRFENIVDYLLVYIPEDELRKRITTIKSV